MLKELMRLTLTAVPYMQVPDDKTYVLGHMPRGLREERLLPA